MGITQRTRGGTMNAIGIISITVNAMNPIIRYFHANAREFSITNYLDEGLQKQLTKEGAVNDACLSRMEGHIERAISDGAEAALLTCTVFTPFVSRFAAQFGVPVVSPDTAMMEQAAAMDKKTAILCTFPATVTPTAELYAEAAKTHGNIQGFEIFLLDDAADAMNKGDSAGHNRIIAEKASALSKDFDLIVLAQISMSEAAALIKNLAKPVLTSPACMLTAIRNLAGMG